jgi:hypothetical protein
LSNWFTNFTLFKRIWTNPDFPPEIGHLLTQKIDSSYFPFTPFTINNNLNSWKLCEIEPRILHCSCSLLVSFWRNFASQFYGQLISDSLKVCE